MDRSLMYRPTRIMASRSFICGVPRNTIIFHSSMYSIWPVVERFVKDQCAGGDFARVSPLRRSFLFGPGVSSSSFASPMPGPSERCDTSSKMLFVRFRIYEIPFVFISLLEINRNRRQTLLTDANLNSTSGLVRSNTCDTSWPMSSGKMCDSELPMFLMIMSDLCKQSEKIIGFH